MARTQVTHFGSSSVVAQATHSSQSLNSLQCLQCLVWVLADYEEELEELRAEFQERLGASDRFIAQLQVGPVTHRPTLASPVQGTSGTHWQWSVAPE